MDPKEAAARAKFVVAEAEIALVSRQAGLRRRATQRATQRATLEEHGDRVKAAHARYFKVRRHFLSQFICECVEFFVEFDEIRKKYAQQGPAVFLRLVCIK